MTVKIFWVAPILSWLLKWSVVFWESPTWPVDELVTWRLSGSPHTHVFQAMRNTSSKIKCSSCQIEGGLPRKHTLRNQKILWLYPLPGWFAFISSTFCWAVCLSTNALTHCVTNLDLCSCQCGSLNLYMTRAQPLWARTQTAYLLWDPCGLFSITSPVTENWLFTPEHCRWARL